MKTKYCVGCSSDKPVEEFSVDRYKRVSGRVGRCKPCRGLVYQKWCQSKSGKAFYANRAGSEKAKARDALRHAVRAGKIERLPCEVCKKKPSHGHHTDYSKPFDVRWLCVVHHSEVHNALIKKD